MVSPERSTLPSLEAMTVYAMTSSTDAMPSSLAGVYTKVLMMAADGSCEIIVMPKYRQTADPLRITFLVL